jgi:hypothetical protein
VRAVLPCVVEGGRGPVPAFVVSSLASFVDLQVGDHQTLPCAGAVPDPDGCDTVPMRGRCGRNLSCRKCITETSYATICKTRVHARDLLELRRGGPKVLAERFFQKSTCVRLRVCVIYSLLLRGKAV